MTDPIVFGFPRSTFVQIVRMILTHKAIPYTFRDLEPEMGKPTHLALHPFNRVPILQHGDFTLYETSAIATYLDDTFTDPPLAPRRRGECGSRRPDRGRRPANAVHRPRNSRSRPGSARCTCPRCSRLGLA